MPADLPTKAPPTWLAGLSSFAEVPGFEFDEGGSNVSPHHELIDEAARSQPWKEIYEVLPIPSDQAVLIGVNPYAPYVADSGNIAGW